MKIFKIFILIFLCVVLLAGGFIAWLCTGSFVYQSSMTKKFSIDAPISVVCKRALNAKSIPQSEDGVVTNIDVQKTVKNVTLGEPMEVEFDHPKLGKIKAKIEIWFETTPTSLQIQGKVVEIEPNHFKKWGKSLADVNNFSFNLEIIAKDAKPGGLFQRFPTTLFQLLPTTGSTEIVLSSASELKIYFREMGFIRPQIDRAFAKSQKKILAQIEKFIDENLRQPTEDELSGQQKPEKKKKKKRFRNITETVQEVPQQENDETNKQDVEGIDLSALDEK